VSARAAAVAVSAAIALLASCLPPEPALPPPLLCSLPPCSWQRLGAVLDSAVRANAAPGGVVAVSYRGHRYTYGAGRLGLDDPTRPTEQTLYDLASLTKVVATTSLAMIAVNQGHLALDSPVTRYVPAFRGPGKEAVTIRHLLTHTSGLRPDLPLWRRAADARGALALVNTIPLDSPPGQRAAYSDLGAIVLGEAIERALGRRLDYLAHAYIFSPLKMRNTRFRPPDSWLPRVAPTEYDTAWRKRIVRGEVHDEKAAFLGGVAGHAGVFGTAEDLLSFGEWMLQLVEETQPAPSTPREQWLARRARDACNLTGIDRRPLCPSDRLRWYAREFTRRQNIVPGSSRALGWDTPTPGSSAGTRLDPSSFGHTGFTGTSLWIDPTRHLVIVLLTNRVHPVRSNSGHVPLRVAVADLAAAIVDSARTAAR
jgi:CubicO group peptidase (beta-lactamase class C family)